MKLNLSAGLVAGLIALTPAPALAAPVTVTLRIEGPTRTLFEGPVTTDARPFHFSDGVDHDCGGTTAMTGAAVTAATDAGLQTAGTWFNGLGPSFATIGGENVAYDAGTNKFLVEYLNGSQDLGSCSSPIANGDQVLYAYGTGSEQLLGLSGPARVAPGAGATLKVTDLATGAPVAGATVGGQTSAADGTVTVPGLARGDNAFKASKDGAIRSNAVDVCATNGSDGACGTTAPVSCACVTSILPRDMAPPAAKLAGIADHQAFKTGPRQLGGSFSDASAIATVKLRLTKRLGKRCWYFSGKHETFRRTRCGTGAYFAIGSKADWSYLLPSRLTKGRYVLDAVAIDAAGNRTPLARGTTRVVFTVR
jgi:hypothetical protein